MFSQIILGAGCTKKKSSLVRHFKFWLRLGLRLRVVYFQILQDMSDKDYCAACLCFLIGFLVKCYQPQNLKVLVLHSFGVIDAGRKI